MRFRTLLLLLILGAVTAFSILNWGALNAPTTLSLGLAEVQAPLGMVMLGIVVVLTAFFLAFLVYVQASALFESRRHAQESAANRDLADKAEASRFTELRAFIDAELRKIGERDIGSPASDAALLARLDRLEQTLLTATEQSANGVAACIAELDDRLAGHSVLPREHEQARQ
ncbi:MAG TPA: LapA family protein [Accumulibacter sp.]|jgi:hypothetical protein|nr:LapA family protein [Accumulibacter sp.]HQC78923.1 LapA family protein [Accumulibacter sp.]